LESDSCRGIFFQGKFLSGSELGGSMAEYTVFVDNVATDGDSEVTSYGLEAGSVRFDTDWVIFNASQEDWVTDVVAAFPKSRVLAVVQASE
jgi:hypothetical protein